MTAHLEGRFVANLMMEMKHADIKRIVRHMKVCKSSVWGRNLILQLILQFGKQYISTIALHLLDCGRLCFGLHDPVCGSDGKTYSNKCYLEAERDCHNPSLTVVHEGECNKGNLPCIPKYAKFSIFLTSSCNDAILCLYYAFKVCQIWSSSSKRTLELINCQEL